MPDSSHLIIGGTTKAATTSLFNYLAVHPQVCAAKNKETRFFLDPDYPAELRSPHFLDGAEHYSRFFPTCQTGQIRLEATPDYLHSRGTAARIRATLPEARLIFVLRDPIDRLVSWYRFARQNHLIAAALSFEAYVDLQFEQLENDVEPDQQHLLALRQGRYEIDLARYRELFAPEELLLLDFQALVDSSQQALEQVCAFAGLDPDVFAGFQPEVFNRTQAMRSTRLHGRYLALKRAIRRRLQASALHAPLQRLTRTIEPWYQGLNRRQEQRVVIPPSLEAELRTFYRRADVGSSKGAVAQ